MGDSFWFPLLIAIVGPIIGYLASERRLRSEIKSAENRLQRDYQLELAAETVVRKLLSIDKWKLRTFDELKRRLHGLDEDEIRKILIRAGAVCFQGKGSEELWGLVDRNHDQLVKD